MCRKWVNITKLFWNPKKEYNKPIQEIEKLKGILVTIEKESVSKKDLIRLVEEKEERLKKYEDNKYDRNKWKNRKPKN